MREGMSSNLLGDEVKTVRAKSMIDRARMRRRAAALLRDARAPIVISAGVALVEQLNLYFPSLPEPANLILVAVVVAGFLSSVNSALFSSLIAVAYGLIFVPQRHEFHGGSLSVCVEGIYLAIAAPFLAILASLVRQNADRASETLRKHLTNTPLGVIELDENYEIRLWAGASASIFGVEPEEAIGKSLFELPGAFFHPEDSDQVQLLLDELDQGIRTRAVHHAQTTTIDGAARHSRWFWSTTLDARGSSSRFLVLVEDITDRIRAEKELEASRTELIQRLVRATEMRDEDTADHIVRMARYCEALARHIGLDDAFCDRILLATQMHDVGKLGVPDRVLLKDGPLTPDEVKEMQLHTVVGSSILSGSNSALIQMAECIALTHHERWDGTGYPNHLVGTQIPIEGRICAVCDVFDALTSKRPYKEPWSLKDALAELRRMAGSHLDPELVEAFLSILPEIESIRTEYSTPFEIPIRKAA